MIVPPKKPKLPRRSFTVSKDDAGIVRLFLSRNLITYNYKIEITTNFECNTTFNALISDEDFSIIKLSVKLLKDLQLELDV